MAKKALIPALILPEDNENELAESTKQRRKSGFGIGRWLSYTKTDKYNGIQPGTRLISREELALHAKSDDMWIALPCSGKLGVYDITPFAQYHPGGVDLLLENSGVDASEAFRMAHSYVSVNMISKLRIGYLDADDPRIHGTSLLSPRMLPQKSLLSIRKQLTWKWHHNPPTDSSGAGSVLLSLTLPPQNQTSQLLSDLQEYRLVAVWRPGVTTCQRGEFLLRVLLDDAVYHYLQFRLLPSLTPRLSTLKVGVDPAKSTGDSMALSRLPVSLNLDISVDSGGRTDTSQCQNGVLTTIGSVLCDRVIPLTRVTEINWIDSFVACRVIESIRLENTRYRLLKLTWPDGLAWVPIPLGHHVLVRLRSESGDSISRPYTPVTPMSKLDGCVVTQLSTGAHLSLLIKVYPDGQLSPLLDRLCVGDSLDVSLPMGKVPIDFPSVVEQNDRPLAAIFMLAAGSGITPMLRPLVAALFPGHCEKQLLPSVHMLCFNRDRSDQVLVGELQRLASELPDRFSVLHILSEPSQPGDDLIQGRIDDNICKNGLLNLQFSGIKPEDIQDRALWLICGPSGFNEAAVRIAHSWNVTDRCLIVFSG